MKEGFRLIWDALKQTNPEHTKPFKRQGGFSGTCVNSTYVIEKITKNFGVCGVGWGYEIVSEEYKDGAPIIINDKPLMLNGSVACEVLHVLRVKVWIKQDGELVGEAEHYGQTMLVHRNKYGLCTDEEAPKKSLTDALSKAFSMFGCSADVFMGQYDDSKYVDDLVNKFSFDEYVDKIQSAATTKSVKDIFAEAWKGANNKEQQEKIKKIYENKKQELGVE